MQHNPHFYYQCQSSMDSIWNNNSWIYDWNPYY
ncbi:cupin, partial [Bacillus cereus]